MNERASIIWVVLCVLVGGYGGYNIGAQHPGKVLVPAEKGVPSDLPDWACEELVDLRLQSADMLSMMQDLVAHPPKRNGPGVVWHFRVPPEEACS